MIRAAAAAVVALLPALAVGPAAAQAGPDEGVRFDGKHAFRSLNCRGGDAVISGDANELKLTDCSRLTVSGARNRITVFLSSPGDIAVSGSNNAIRYRSPADGAPPVTDTGKANDIRPTA